MTLRSEKVNSASSSKGIPFFPGNETTLKASY
ncbi:hypothetical protein COLO4_03254 [Corchorus olitorius]|uniref:Uncharacterized protein n=1 Tax=Corchorus olitorius TaxID=93759 RepID=A0A1R3KZ76_9ROSI|nr:hypothetical protein COLO4_03254 [Corchorus olitorius]